MSSPKPRSDPPEVTASAPILAASSTDARLGNGQSRGVAVEASKLQSPLPTSLNASAFVSQPKCMQITDSNGSGLASTMLPSAVSALLVVVGWFVVNKAQANRERRKQIREHVADLCDDLDELETLTIGYHTATRVEAKEQEIISKLGRLEKASFMLPRFVEAQWRLFKAVRPRKLKMDGRRLQVLRKAMTLNHFGDEHTSPLGHQDDFIADLELAAMELRDALECVRIDSLD